MFKIPKKPMMVMLMIAFITFPNFLLAQTDPPPPGPVPVNNHDYVIILVMFVLLFGFLRSKNLSKNNLN